MGRVCWIDLATSDPAAATTFYGGLFGWRARVQRIGHDGRFSTFAKDGPPFASLYRLTSSQVAHGVPSLWMPYVSVPDVDEAASRAVHLSGEVMVAPQIVEGFARVAVIADPTGALIGLWQDAGEGKGERAQGGT
jgi:predicted enzyme related to lactoylglutathione lyase